MGVSKSGLEKYWNWKNFTESSGGKFLPWIATKHSKSAGILFEIQMYLLLNERNQRETILWDKFIHEAHDGHGQDVAVDDELQNKHQQHFQELQGDDSLDNRNLALGEEPGETDPHTHHSWGQH